MILGCLLGAVSCEFWQVEAFATLLLVFHVSEFVLAAVYMRSELSARSLLITRGYAFAMTAAVVEFWLEARWLPALKRCTACSLSGLAIALAGDALRKSAMVTAGHSFTHLIQHTRRPEHTLIKHGVYRHIRHPGYLGWLLWAVGTQVLLVNPLCTLGFAYTAWRFFAVRIPYEEAALVQLFGGAYEAYARATPTWIPFIP